MKKVFGIFLIVVIFGGLFFYLVLKPTAFRSSSKEIKKENQKTEAKSQDLKINQPLDKAKNIEEKESIFIPDWQMGSLESVETSQSQLGQYQRLIYFGKEAGLEKFIKLIAPFKNDKEIWFTIKINEIPDEKNQLLMVEKANNIVKNYNLQGVALDLEVNGLPTENLVKQINNFVQHFRKRREKEGWQLAIILYGDTFYRKRPFDVRFLSENSDEVMVMAYDFHKSYGEPGPNFPFEKFSDTHGLTEEKSRYEYSFKQMVNDFLKFVPPAKLTVIFGMYGYDWQVDEKKRPINQAKALTLKQIKEKFFLEPSLNRSDKDGTNICTKENCLIKRDEVSKETEINYVISSKTPDEQGIYRLDYHIVWFEDEESVKIKTDFLREKGVGSVVFWAYNYF